MENTQTKEQRVFIVSVGKDLTEVNRCLSNGWAIMSTVDTGGHGVHYILERLKPAPEGYERLLTNCIKNPSEI